MTQLFPANVRYTGVAAGRELATVVGGLTPAIAAALIGVSGTPWLFVAFLMVCSLLGVIGLFAARPLAAELDVQQAGAPGGRPEPVRPQTNYPATTVSRTLR